MIKLKPLFKFKPLSKDIVCLFGILIITLAYVLPIFKNISNLSHNNDLTINLSLNYFQKLSLTYYHQFPLWSPYFGGGYPVIGNIQDTSLTLLMPFTLIFGEVTSFKLLCFFLYLSGAWGMYYLTRNIYKYSILGSFFSILVFVFNPYFNICVSGGDPKQLHYLLYPLLLALFIKSRENQKFLYICSFVFTIMLFQADFVALIFLLFLGLYIIPILLEKHQTKPYFELTYLFNFFRLIGISFFLGAVKFITLLEILSLNSRKISSYYLSANEAVSFRELTNNLIGINYTRTLHYSIGLLPIILALCSIFMFKNKLKSLILPLIIIIWLAMGYHAPIDLWRIFRHLPFFQSQQDLFQYYPIVAVMLIALISGKLFSIIQFSKKQRIITRIFFSLTLLIYAIIRLSPEPDHFNIFTHPAIKENIVAHEFTQAKVLYYSDQSNEIDINRDFIGPLQYYLIKNNIGTINWNAPLPLDEYSIPKYYIMPNYFFLAHNPGYSKIINPFYLGEAYTLDHYNNAQIKHFSPLKLIIDLELQTPDILVINQNYNRYWHTSSGKLEAYNGLLAVRFDEPGHYSVKLVYIPYDFYAGLVISLLSFIFIINCLFSKVNPNLNKQNIETRQKPDINNLTAKNRTDKQSLYLLIFIGAIAAIGQIYTPIIPVSVLVNRGCAEKTRQDREFLKSAKKISPQQILDLKPWAVGQYAVYKITGLGQTKNTFQYKIAITGKQIIDNQDYFWLEHTLYTNNSKKRAVFKTLRPALTKHDLIENPLFFFEQGIYPKNPERFIMQIDNNPEIEINPNKFNEIISPLQFNLFSDSLFLKDPDISEDKFSIFSKEELCEILKTQITCSHLLFEIKQKPENYQFNLWHSKEIPILGLVKMDLFRIKKDPDYNNYPDKIVLIDYGIEDK